MSVVTIFQKLSKDDNCFYSINIKSDMIEIKRDGSVLNWNYHPKVSQSEAKKLFLSCFTRYTWHQTPHILLIKKIFPEEFHVTCEKIFNKFFENYNEPKKWVNETDDDKISFLNELKKLSNG